MTSGRPVINDGTTSLLEFRMNDTSKDERFEDQLARLEDIVARLEDEGVGLEESLDLFEQGMSLVRSCRTRLESVEQRVAKLMEEGDGVATEELEVDES
jgi:exodeoxyribonuclease VII small subunit